MLFDKNGPIAMEKKFWLKFYIERLPLWRARRFREWKLAKTWATKHGLQCIINDNSNKINDDDNHKLIHSYNHNENEMNQIKVTILINLGNIVHSLIINRFWS